MSSLHELRDSSSSTAVSGTKVPVCVGENSINQLSLASTYRKTFLLEIHFQQLVGERFYIFYMFYLPYFKFALLLKFQHMGFSFC